MDRRRSWRPTRTSPTPANSPTAVDKLQSGQAAGQAHDSLDCAVCAGRLGGNGVSEARARVGEIWQWCSVALSSSIAALFPYPPVIPRGVDRFPDKEPTGVLSVAEHPVLRSASTSTRRRMLSFAASLTGGRYAAARGRAGRRDDQLFPLRLSAPQDRAQPFRVSTTVMPSPWSADNQLLHIAIRGYDIARAERPRANVVLLIDTSGSMQPSDRLPLLQQGFRLFAAAVA